MAELNVGDTAPDFILPTSEGGDVSISGLKGRIVVLYFYPKDNTSGCTKEACTFRDFKSEFDKLGAVIYGVSPDSLKSHDSFINKFELNFPLIADTKREAAEKYGVYVLKKMYGKESKGILRSTFVIDKDGKIAKIWRQVNVDGHIDAVLEFVKSMQK